MERTEILIGGLGGQGVILAGTVIGKAAAIFGGKHATLIQAFGPEARGSACSAQVTIADEPIAYPYVRRPDVLVVLSGESYTRFGPSLKPGGLLLYEEDMVRVSELPPGAVAHGIPATRFAEELGRRLFLSMVMVGFVGGVTGLLPREAFEKAVADSVPRGTQDLNLKAFKRGYEYGLQRLRA